MADKNPANMFMDMFKSFGGDLNLPGPQVNDVLDHHRRNIQALQDAAQTASAGGQALMAKQREALEEALADITDMVQSATQSGADPSQIMSDQAEFARKSFETTVRNATEMGGIVRDSGAEAFGVLKTRVEESLSEISGGLKKD